MPPNPSPKPSFSSPPLSSDASTARDVAQEHRKMLSRQKDAPRMRTRYTFPQTHTSQTQHPSTSAKHPCPSKKSSPTTQEHPNALRRLKRRNSVRQAGCAPTHTLSQAYVLHSKRSFSTLPIRTIMRRTLVTANIPPRSRIATRHRLSNGSSKRPSHLSRNPFPKRSRKTLDKRVPDPDPSRHADHSHRPTGRRRLAASHSPYPMAQPLRPADRPKSPQHVALLAASMNRVGKVPSSDPNRGYHIDIELVIFDSSSQGILSNWAALSA